MKKIVLLTNGLGETSWFLMKEISNNFDTLIISKFGTISLGKKLLHITILIRNYLFDELKRFFLGHDNFRPYLPPLFNKMNFINIENDKDYNSEKVYRKIKEFRPDIICISGTKKIDKKILNIAKYSLNLHHGFLPFYRGVTSHGWAILEKRFDYIGATIHEATNKIDSGKIYNYVSVTPLWKENISQFRRRLYLTGAKELIKTLNKIHLIKPISQMDKNIFNYKKINKFLNFEKTVQKEFYSKNTKRYIINSEIDASKNKKLLNLSKKIFITFNKKKKLSNGLYIVNYHHICDETFPEINKIPNIYTKINIFQKHLKFYQENFKFISLKNGLEILRKKEMKEKYISITFDDTLKSFLKALNEMKKYSIKPTIFLNTDPLILKKPLANHLKLLCYEFWLKNKKYSLKHLYKWYEKILEKKVIKNKELNKVILLFRKFIVSQYLNQEQIKSCLKNKTIDIGSHTSSHKIFSNKNYDEQYKLIALPHKKLEKIFKKKIDFFSFPFGKIFQRNFYSEYIAEKISKHYFSCSGGINTKINKGAINRIAIHNEEIDELNNLLLNQYLN